MVGGRKNPDFLDSSCRLRDGVDEAMATESAEKALGIQSQLAKTAYHQFRNWLKE